MLPFNSFWPLHCYSCPTCNTYDICIWYFEQGATEKPLTLLFMVLMMVLRASKSIMASYREAQALKHPINNKTKSEQKPPCYNNGRI